MFFITSFVTKSIKNNQNLKILVDPPYKMCKYHFKLESTEIKSQKYWSIFSRIYHFKEKQNATHTHKRLIHLYILVHKAQPSLKLTITNRDKVNNPPSRVTQIRLVPRIIKSPIFDALQLHNRELIICRQHFPSPNAQQFSLIYLPPLAKTQYLHFRSHANCCLLPGEDS